jgi:small ligand-binding sensory domain FIST
VVLGGAVHSSALVSQGCRPVGPVMTVTAAEGNVLLGLAGRPAVEQLERVVADLTPEEQALVTTGLQLGIAMDEYADEHSVGDFLVRGVVGAEPERGGLVVGDVVDVGRTVQFQVRDAMTADADLRTVLDRAGSGTDVAGALLFSCTGRGAGLFGTADHDVRAVRAGLGTAGVAGFFAAGEIGPVGGRNHLHGFTASVLSFAAGPGGSS